MQIFVQRFLKIQITFFFVGEKKNELNFIKKSLNKNLIYNFYKKKDSNTFTKMRYLDSYKNIKILGIYDVDKKKLDETTEKKIYKETSTTFKKSSYNNFG